MNCLNFHKLKKIALKNVEGKVKICEGRIEKHMCNVNRDNYRRDFINPSFTLINTFLHNNAHNRVYLKLRAIEIKR